MASARACWPRSRARSASRAHLIAAITGLAALLHTSAVAFQVLKYLGVAYLLFMAWSTLRDKEALTAVFMALTFVVFAAYGWFAAAIRSHVISRPKVLTWLRRVFAGGFAALGARLAFGDV